MRASNTQGCSPSLLAESRTLNIQLATERQNLMIYISMFEDGNERLQCHTGSAELQMKHILTVLVRGHLKTLMS